MTTPWKIEPIWKGETVAILASGPSMSKSVADALKQHRCIAVNHTCILAPWAEMLVALDGDWPQEFRDFAGACVTGVADDNTDALYAGSMYETIEIAPGNTIEIRNSGLAAIRIAAALGASRIILAGFDPELKGYWYGDGEGQSNGTEPYIGLRQGIDSITAECEFNGIIVERFVPVFDQAITDNA